MFHSNAEANSPQISSDDLLVNRRLSDYGEPSQTLFKMSEDIGEDESETIETNYECNTFIFNWVSDYDKQINILKCAMESLQNKVQIYNHLKEKQLLKVVDHLSKTNFELFKYICIIILDNQCPYDQFIRTDDKQDVLLESEILTKIKTNPTLKDVTRLIIIQKLLDIRDIDDEELDHITKMISERNKRKLYLGDTLQFGLSKTLKALEYTDNYADSPFLEVFSQKFRDQANRMAISEIFNDTRREIKKRDYKINIEDGSNQLPTTNAILGEGISNNALRDFFD